jgi:hypothetical protein
MIKKRIKTKPSFISGIKQSYDKILWGVAGLLSGIFLTMTIVLPFTNDKKFSCCYEGKKGCDSKMYTKSNCTNKKTRESELNNNHKMHNEMSMGDMSDALTGLSGKEFDRAFLQLMIEHHQGAVEMSQMALRLADSKEIKSLSEDIIKSQQSEIEMMKGWLK